MLLIPVMWPLKMGITKVTTVNADAVDPHSSQKYSEALNVITSYGMVIH
jgi:hypothetical protein